MEDGGVGYQELLVARGDKGHCEIYERMQHVPTDEEQDRGNSRKVKVE